MNKKSSPQSSPARRPRTRPSGSGVRQSPKDSSYSVQGPGRKLRRFGRKSTDEAVKPVDPTFKSRVRAYFPIVLLPCVVALIVIIIASLVSLLATNTTMAGLPATIAEGWLVLNLGPATGRGMSIGALPLMPAIFFTWVVSQRVFRAVKQRVSLADLAVVTLGVVGFPLLLTATACAMLYDASSVFDVASPNVAMALATTFLVHGTALVIGMRTRLWKALARRYGVSEDVVDAAGLAARLVRNLLLLALVVFVVLLGFHAADVAKSLEGYTPAGMLAVIIVCLLYLPNAVIAVLAVLLGASFEIGEGFVSLMGVGLVPTPAVPLFAAIPGEMSPYALGALVIPFAGVVVTLRGTVKRPAHILLTAAWAAVILAVLGALSSGQLGVYGYVGVLLWLSVALMMAWTLICGFAIFAVELFLKNRAEASVAIAQESEENAPEEAEELEEAETGEPEEEQDVVEVEEPETYELVDDGLDNAEMLESLEINPPTADNDEKVENEGEEETTESDQESDSKPKDDAE
ncbi:hypothetical protein I4I88_02390 [Corynebacterium diphtheriae bv. gravis]|nr:DUF6350 family protein [Corynebacterium diphtheriae]MBG9344194.1 hypothetical protein [Corynebacterium diphtheriae bv. gravis]